MNKVELVRELYPLCGVDTDRIMDVLSAIEECGKTVTDEKTLTELLYMANDMEHLISK